MKTSAVFFSTVMILICNAGNAQNNFPTPNGNVAIGTSSPQAKLHVVGKTILDGPTVINQASKLHFYSEADGPYLTESWGIRAYPFYNSHAFMILNQPMYLGYEADGTNIDSYDGSLMLTNRLGIGTKTPARKVSVNSTNASTIADFGFYQGGVEKSIFGVAGATNDFFTGTAAGDMAIRSTSGKLLLGANSAAAAPAATILQGGNFGIGTIAPSARFHANGTIRFEGLANNNALDRLLVSDANGNLSYRTVSSLTVSSAGWNFDGNTVAALKKFGTSDNYALPIITNNVERMRIETSGNVGIGTNAPQSLLHVNGNYTQTSSSVTGSFMISQPVNNRLTFSHSAIGSFLTVGPENIVRFDGQQISAEQRGASLSNTTGGFSLQTIAGNVALNTTSGNTLIGTSTPPPGEAKLAVKGNIWAHKLRVVSINEWPDYVFENNYYLRPLSEVESFIKANFHLPEVPSAAEVAKDGIDVADNQAILLKKVEELTLYLIEQSKKLELQQQEINDLKQQLKGK